MRIRPCRKDRQKGRHELLILLDWSIPRIRLQRCRKLLRKSCSVGPLLQKRFEFKQARGIVPIGGGECRGSQVWGIGYTSRERNNRCKIAGGFRIGHAQSLGQRVARGGEAF